MNKKVSSSNSGGIGFFGVLTIVFITLKLLGYIDWSWLWVLSPAWGGCLIVLGILGLFLGIMWISEKR
jgi:hypothetical protein